MKIFKKIISNVFLILFLLLLISALDELNIIKNFTPEANAQVCGDGVISGEEKCDRNENVGCFSPDNPYCNFKCTACVCSPSRLIFLDKPLVCSIQDLILFILSVVGGIAMLMLIIGGISYILSGSNPEKQEKAKKTFNYAIGGIVLILISYALIKVVADIGV